MTKLSPTGAVLYSTYLGGPCDDIGNAIAVDAAGNAYITGRAHVLCFFGEASPGVLVAKLGPTGTLLYALVFGGQLVDTSAGAAIAVDAQGHAYVTGTTSSVDFPTTPGAFGPTPARTSTSRRLHRRIRGEGEPRRRLARVLDVPVRQRARLADRHRARRGGQRLRRGHDRRRRLPDRQPVAAGVPRLSLRHDRLRVEAERRRLAPDLLDVSRRVDQRRDQRPGGRRTGQRLRHGGHHGRGLPDDARCLAAAAGQRLLPRPVLHRRVRDQDQRGRVRPRVLDVSLRRGRRQRVRDRGRRGRQRVRRRDDVLALLPGRSTRSSPRARCAVPRTRSSRS